jgi:hypothetical protein
MVHNLCLKVCRRARVISITNSKKLGLVVSISTPTPENGLQVKWKLQCIFWWDSSVWSCLALQKAYVTAFVHAGETPVCSNEAGERCPVERWPL